MQIRRRIARTALPLAVKTNIEVVMISDTKNYFMGVVEGNVQMPLYQKPYSILKQQEMKYLFVTLNIFRIFKYIIYT